MGQIYRFSTFHQGLLHKEPLSYYVWAFGFTMTQIHLPFVLLSGMIALIIHRAVIKYWERQVYLLNSKRCEYTHADNLKGK
jgi:hypothetical protein